VTLISDRDCSAMNKKRVEPGTRQEKSKWRQRKLSLFQQLTATFEIENPARI
jgi:hypothetical protein